MLECWEEAVYAKCTSGKGQETGSGLSRMVNVARVTEKVAQIKTIKTVAERQLEIDPARVL